MYYWQAQVVAMSDTAKNKKNGGKRIFTFRADADVAEILAQFDGEVGEKTKRINEALRRHLAEVEAALLEAEIAEKKARLASLNAKRR